MRQIERLTYAGAQAETEKSFAAFEAYWAQEEKHMAYVIDHVHLNSFSCAVDELEMAIYAASEADVLMLSARVRKEAESIAADELFLPENIF